MASNAEKYAGAGVALTVAAAAFIAPWEGFEPVAKHEKIDPPHVITYGYGRTNYDDASLKAGDTITKAEAKELLGEDLGEKYIPPLRKCIPGFDKMPQTRQVAFTSAAYNLGGGTVCKSSMAHKINAGDVQGACNAFLLYDKANGVVIKGLESRRKAEREMCLRDGPVIVADAAPPAPPPVRAEPHNTPAPKKSWLARFFDWLFGR